jgi:hypothetical protein
MSTVTFDYTGAVQDWTVPALVYAIDVQMWAPGGTGTGIADGGFVSCTIPVLPGDVVHVYVGQRPVAAGHDGGWPNGGLPGNSGAYSGAGSSDLRLGGTAESNRVCVAGAGGGRGTGASLSGGAGGAGGGAIAAAGGSVSGAAGGAGGTQTIPASGTGGVGGTGGSSGFSAGGGGGGGFNGGGGGEAGSTDTSPAGGGGGGSNYVATTAPRGAVTNAVSQANVATRHSLNGQVIFTYVVATPTAPTLVSPVADADVDVTQTTTLLGQFNTPSTALHLASASIRYKTSGGPTWTTIAATIAADLFSHDFAGAFFTPDTTIEWQGQTTDDQGNVSPWSASLFFTPRTPPNAPTITAPTAGATIHDLTSQPIVITSTVGQTDSQFKRVGDHAGAPDITVVYEDSGPLGSAVLSYNFTNGAAHSEGPEHWRARIRTNSSLWSPFADVAVEADILPAPAPILSLRAETDPPRTIIQITNPDPDEDQGDAVATDLYRTWNGQTVPIARGLPNNSTVIDWGAGPDDNNYIAYAISGTGAVTPSE